MLPLTNRIADQRNLTGNLAALLKWDSTVFDLMQVPERLDRQLVIDTIMLEEGLRPLAHPDPSWMKQAIGLWSRRRIGIWNQMIDTTEYEYDPIYNYNRMEETTDSREIDRNLNVNNSYKENQQQEGSESRNYHYNDDNRTQTDVSADNADDYQPESQVLQDNKRSEIGSTDTENDINSSGSGNGAEQESTGETFTHKAKMYGNIGVTTTQQMIEEQRKVILYSVIENITREFVDEFCLGVWG